MFKLESKFSLPNNVLPESVMTRGSFFCFITSNGLRVHSVKGSFSLLAIDLRKINSLCRRRGFGRAHDGG